MYGKHPSEETRIKMSEARRGKHPGNKGIPMSEEAKKKISEFWRKKKETKENIKEEIL